jgi:hypothetical protein
MPGTKGIVTIGTMSESMNPPTVRPNPGPIRRVNMPHKKKNVPGFMKEMERTGKKNVPGYMTEMRASGKRKPKRGSGRTRKSGR